MRFVDKDEVPKPVILDSLECSNHLNQILNNPNLEANENLYKGKILHDNGECEYTVRDSLKTLYKNKCGYCEKASNKPEIDHHRPKNKVVGTNRNNKGYYWLCYEWTNLIPACHACNSFEAKGSNFPISDDGIRNSTHPINNGNIDIEAFKYNSQFNLAEQVLLLHPEYCNPEQHFRFDRDGRIIGTSAEGIATVAILKIDNADLNGWRRTIYNRHLANLKYYVKGSYNGEINEEQYFILLKHWVEILILESLDEELEYTLFRKFLIKEIDYFFIATFEEVFQQDLRVNIAKSIMEIIVQYGIELHY